MVPKRKLQNYSTRTIKVLYFILILNLAVLFIKIFAGIVTKSISILSDAAHSAIDALNNIVGLVVLKYAVEPPDKEHPYGHGKFETLASFAIVIFLVIACVEIAQNSVTRLMHPVELPLFKAEIIWLLLITLGVNIFVWLFERNQGKKLRSDLLIADSSHTGSDVLITISVLCSQYFIAKKMYFVDPVIAIFIAVFIVRAVMEIVKSTVPILVDGTWVDSKEIKKAVLSVDGVTDCYEIYSRKSPYVSFIECKIKVEPKDLYNAHKIADKVEEKLRSDFGKCKVTVHVEP